MQIISYEYKDTGDDLWKFTPIKFKKINLIVGDTGTGKTRLLNTIFNLGLFAANDTAQISPGSWDITFIREDLQYRWQLQIDNKPEEGPVITQERLWRLKDDDNVLLVSRDDSGFFYHADKLPKLPKNKTSILLLKEEEEIKPITTGFGSIMRRRFSEDELEKIAVYQPIPRKLLRQIQKTNDLNRLFHSNLQLNARLFFLMRFFTKRYNLIINRYRQFFPFITAIEIQEISILHEEISSAAEIPVFCIKEKGVNKWVELAGLSSGMKKTLLMLTDIYMLPDDGGVYLIDEYENSLGANTIDFLPTVLYEDDINSQFIITSHHPYIINKIPVNNWFVFHRSGSEVTVRYGEELIEKYGKSRQEAFIKLLNDPFFKRGIG